MNLHGDKAKIEHHDLRPFGIDECPLIETIASWGSMHTNGLHKHEGVLELCYLDAGRRVYLDENRLSVMLGGNIWRNSPGVAHSSMGRPSGSSVFYCWHLLPPQPGKIWCGLDADEARRVWDQLLTLDPPAHTLAGEGTKACFERILSLIKTPNMPHHSTLLRLAFNSLVATFALSAFNPPKPAEGTQSIRELIDRINTSDPKETLEVQVLAKQMGLSTSYFVSSFQKIVGQTPGQYILSRRLEAAARRIASGMPIKEVAADYNFDSTQHFTRSFGKYFLETPKRYYLRVKAEKASHVKDAALP